MAEAADKKRSEIMGEIWGLKGIFLSLSVLSAVVNVLALTSSVYMLQVYDRVLGSHSLATLAALSVLVVVAYAFQGAIDLHRARILQRLAVHFDEVIGPRVFRIVVDLPIRHRTGAEGNLPLRDLEAIRQFLASSGPTAVLDLPWIPVFLIFLFVLSPWLCLLAAVGSVTMVVLTVIADRLGREPAKLAAYESSRRMVFAESCRRNAEVLHAMGMKAVFGERWATMNAGANDRALAAQDVGNLLAGLSKVIRYVLQSAALGFGAFLVIEGDIAAGSIIAGTIATARALAPIEIAIANWRGFTAARQARERLDMLLGHFQEEPERMELPEPRQRLTVEGVSCAPPGENRPVIHDVSFGLVAGDGLGIIGPSSAGKSTLVRTLVGVWQPLRGKVRLDGSAIDHWDNETLGRHIGYLPQDCELFAGTVAQNIARFRDDADPADIVAAATDANVHGLIQRLPQGYDTQIGEGGTLLSAGQRQRIGLARALFGNPFLVVLDEPNSNLDMEGDSALTYALQGIRMRGGIVVVVAHRPSALVAVNKIAVMNAGRLQGFGPKDQMIQLTTGQPQKERPVAAIEKGERRPADVEEETAE
jgi:PrtD family type I secretion system ABC transporter